MNIEDHFLKSMTLIWEVLTCIWAAERKQFSREKLKGEC